MSNIEIIKLVCIYVYAGINVIGTIAFGLNCIEQHDCYEWYEDIWLYSNMNKFGRILCTILVIIFVPLLLILTVTIHFVYWITHVKPRKKIKGESNE